jgi:hypothetical protein
MKTAILATAGRAASRPPAVNAWLLALYRRGGLPAVIRALKLRDAGLARKAAAASLFTAPAVDFEHGRLTFTDAA